MQRRQLGAKEWIQIINRMQLSESLPVTLQGGEPSIHPGFFEILKNINSDIPIDILTNLQFDLDKFMHAAAPERFKRKAPYAAIRVSYHPETMTLNSLMEKADILKKAGYPIAVYTVDHPKAKNEIERARELASKLGITFKTKELIGEIEGKVYGEFKYEGAVASKKLKSCECKTTELLLCPEGRVFRCHHDLYNRVHPIGDILDPNFKIEDKFRPCEFYGNCNPCDIKVKNNRFQKFGHTSVEIKNIKSKRHIRESAFPMGVS